MLTICTQQAYISNMKGGIKMDRELKRVNMNLPSALVEKIDAYAQRLCINRSAAVTVLLSFSLEQQGGLEVLQEMMKLYKQNGGALAE